MSTRNWSDSKTLGFRPPIMMPQLSYDAITYLLFHKKYNHNHNHR